MNRNAITPDMVIDLISLYESKGKEFYYEEVLKADFESINKGVVEKDAMFLTKMLNINISEARARMIIKKEIIPRNKDEQLVFNIKQCLSTINENPNDFDLIPNTVYDMIEFVYKDVDEIKFEYDVETDKNGKMDLFGGKRRHISRADKLTELFRLYNKKRDSKEYELTALIANFYVDFLNMKIFNKHNDVAALFLIFVLLCQNGFKVVMNTSFFEQLSFKFQSFNEAIMQANFNWSSGYSETVTLQRIIIKLLLDLYKQYDRIVDDYKFDENLKKTDNIESTIMKLGEIFTKDEIRNIHPYVSDSTINRTLKRMRDDGLIEPMGTGRSAKWMRLVQTPKKFTVSSQMSLFDEEK